MSAVLDKKVMLLLCFIGVSLLITACGPANGSSQAQLEAVTNLANQINAAETDVQRIVERSSGLDEKLTEVEEGLDSFTVSAATHVLDRTADIPEPPEGKVALRLGFTYSPDPLPGAGLKVYNSTPEVNSLWAMESLPKGEPLPVGEEISANTLFMEPGETRSVTIAYENPSGEDVGFLVLPHQDSPGHLATKVWPQCLCMSFVYTAPAEGSWYRVIRITISPEMPEGAKVDTSWLVLTDSAVFPVEEGAAVSSDTDVKATEPTGAEDLVAEGLVLSVRNGCAACHSSDGSPSVGPTWLGLAGGEETLVDGAVIMVDEAYLYESIVDPNAKVVEGFTPNIMPQDFADKLSDAEIQAIIAYIQSLSE